VVHVDIRGAFDNLSHPYLLTALGACPGKGLPPNGSRPDMWSTGSCMTRSPGSRKAELLAPGC
jgi:hypothetical protein